MILDRSSVSKHTTETVLKTNKNNQITGNSVRLVISDSMKFGMIELPYSR